MRAWSGLRLQWQQTKDFALVSPFSEGLKPMPTLWRNCGEDEMGKKPEDNRDVFEKALDVLVPASGAYLGAVAGRKMVKGHQRDMAKYRDPRLDSDLAKSFQAGQRVGGLFWGGLAGGAAANAVNQSYNQPKQKRK